MNIVPLAVPQLEGNEAKYVQECLDTNFVSSVGPFVGRFEREFAGYVGARHAVACASGTAALHVAMEVLGAAPGKLVAVSDFTFIASVNAVVYTGAEPYAVDSERTTWNLDADLLHADVVRRARDGRPLPHLIEVVHVLGHPADLEPLIDLRERFGIPILEDAAEALGATYATGTLAGRHVGTVGDIGCFSFNGNKTITTGGGGMIVTDDGELAARAKHLTTQAKTSSRGYVHDEVGYNYRLTNVAAAIGLGQLEQASRFLAAKRAIAERYDAALSGLPGEPPPRAGWAEPSFWLYSLLLERGGVQRDCVLDSMEAAGIQARPLWPPLHRQPPYASIARLGGDVADDLFERGLSLPSSVGLTADEQERVISALEVAVVGSAVRG